MRSDMTNSSKVTPSHFDISERLRRFQNLRMVLREIDPCAIPHSKEPQHERAVILLQTLNSVFGAKSQHLVKPLHKNPKILKPCQLGCKFTIIVIAPVQGAAVKAYLNKEAVVCHRQSIAVCLAKQTPIDEEIWHFLQEGYQ